jgi:hypothetical protein
MKIYPFKQQKIEYNFFTKNLSLFLFTSHTEIYRTQLFQVIQQYK